MSIFSHLGEVPSAGSRIPFAWQSVIQVQLGRSLIQKYLWFILIHHFRSSWCFGTIFEKKDGFELPVIVLLRMNASIFDQVVGFA